MLNEKFKICNRIKIYLACGQLNELTSSILDSKIIFHQKKESKTKYLRRGNAR